MSLLCLRTRIPTTQHPYLAAVLPRYLVVSEQVKHSIIVSKLPGVFGTRVTEGNITTITGDFQFCCEEFKEFFRINHVCFSVDVTHTHLYSISETNAR